MIRRREKAVRPKHQQNVNSEDYGSKGVGVDKARRFLLMGINMLVYLFIIGSFREFFE